MPDWSSIIQQLESAGVAVAAGSIPAPVSGGDISAAWRFATKGGDLFIKTAPLSAADMFAAEADGLAELKSASAIRVPQVVQTGRGNNVVYLALEWLDMEQADSTVERCFGEQLAEMHRTTRDQFGWHRDNTIGLTPQINTRSDDWVQFFREHRLGFQLTLAMQNGFAGDLKDRGERLLKRLPIYFEGEEPVASLLHGDLWSGNWGCSNGVPVIFDPAVYYGDRETDLAMTRLFGGFGRDFYDAYESNWPFPEGHVERQHLYQLYHVLNHLNLFGSAYLGRAVELINRLL